MNIIKIEFKFFTIICAVFFLTLKIYCVNILNIFLIYFKMLKLIVIDILGRHNKKIKK